MNWLTNNRVFFFLLLFLLVGYKPDMLKFTQDCQTILVANEGEAYEDNGDLVNPEGSISIIRIIDQISYTVTHLDFIKFNPE